MDELELHNLEKHLKSISLPKPESNVSFERTLRRALLNSSFFSDNIGARWQKRLGLCWKNMFWPAASLTLFVGGFFFIELLAFSAQELPLKTSLPETTNALLTKENQIPIEAVEPQEVFNAWYHDGKIKYKGQEKNGPHVYTIELDHGRMVELVDPNPISFTLTNAR